MSQSKKPVSACCWRTTATLTSVLQTLAKSSLTQLRGTRRGGIFNTNNKLRHITIQRNQAIKQLLETSNALIPNQTVMTENRNLFFFFDMITKPILRFIMYMQWAMTTMIMLASILTGKFRISLNIICNCPTTGWDTLT